VRNRCGIFRIAATIRKNRSQHNAISYCARHFCIARAVFIWRTGGRSAVGDQRDRRLHARHLNDQRSELRQPSVGDAGCFGVYYAKQRKHSDCREFSGRQSGVQFYAGEQKLDTLAVNNSATLALVNVYSARAKTAAFTIKAEKFRYYAIAWRDRWNSVMELFMAGGNYPTAEVPFPKEFLSAVRTEA
jgi:hypothetical protein